MESPRHREEKVLDLQTRKRSLADSIIRADASLVSTLKREDLEFLLS
jgi:SNF2 family DNA or RNA helicase